jgi:predicted dehydrogenase
MKLPRRSFLAGSAVAAAMRAQAERKVKIAFLGISHSHGSGKLAAVQNNPVFELAGIWEPDAQLAAKQKNVKLLSREEILKDSSIQAIAVESDVLELAKHARAALEAGKHVHIEKPPAATLSEFRKLQDLAAAKQRILQVGYMWRYNPGVEKIFELVHQGWLGDVFLVRAMMNTQVDASSRKAWARFKGGDMFEQGSHLVDFMVRLMGRPANVTSVLRHHGKTHQDSLADNTAAILEWPGALGVLTAAALQPGATIHRFMEVQGSNGTAVLRPIEGPYLALELVKAAGPYSAGPQRVELATYRRYEGDFEDLAQCILKSKPLTVATPEQDLAVHETLLKASQMSL